MSAVKFLRLEDFIDTQQVNFVFFIFRITVDLENGKATKIGKYNLLKINHLFCFDYNFGLTRLYEQN